MRSKHKKLLQDLARKPVLSSIRWQDVESLLIHLGAEMQEGFGSRVAFDLHGVTAVFHRPHPEKEIDKGAVKSIQRFLEAAGVKHEYYDL